MTTSNLHEAAEQVERTSLGQHVAFLELTVDPRRDTVRRIHAYARLYGDAPDWTLATGKPAQVRRLWSALGVSTDKVPGDDPVRDWMTGRPVPHPYDIHHQDVVFVMGADGRLRWITVGNPDANGHRLPDVLHAFLDDEGRRNYAHPSAGGAAAWTAHDIEHAVTYVDGLPERG